MIGTIVQGLITYINLVVLQPCVPMRPLCLSCVVQKFPWVKPSYPAVLLVPLALLILFMKVVVVATFLDGRLKRAHRGYGGRAGYPWA